MSRPTLLVAFCGTATEIGKTWVAARVAEDVAARGSVVVARKPVQSFDPADDAPKDAEVLAAATRSTAEEVCPEHRWLPVPMAPPMAVERLGGAGFTLADLLDELWWPSGADVGLVETVGGVRSPIAEDGDSLDLVRMLEPDLVVLVADAGLGTIDAVRHGTDALDPLATVVFLNRFQSDDDLHVRNRSWLVERDGLQVVHTIADLGDVLIGAATGR